MKYVALAAGIFALIVGVIVALHIASAGEFTPLARRFWGTRVRGVSAYSFAGGILFAGASAFFASCMLLQVTRRAQFKVARDAMFALAAGCLILATYGAVMAKGGVVAP